jgi:hypothetical protein
MYHRAMTYADRLRELAATVQARDIPLGHDFSTGCWGAEAARIASSNGAHPCDYYGFSQETYEAIIKRNAETPPEIRNEEMAQATLAMAAHDGGSLSPVLRR